MNITFILSLMTTTLNCPFTAQESYDFLNAKYKISQSYENSEALLAETQVSISDKCFEDADLIRLCPLKNLTYLYLFNDGCKNNQSSRITGSGLDALTLLPALKFLDLDGNRIQGDQLHKLIGLNNLSTLKLYDNEMKNGNGLEALANLPSLQLLYLDKNGFTDDVFENLKPLCMVNILKPIEIILGFNRINGSGIKLLKDCTRPIRLNLSNNGHYGLQDIGNQISFHTLAGLEGMEALVELNLASALVPSNTLPQYSELKILSRSPNLRILNLNWPSNFKPEELSLTLDLIVSSILSRSKPLAILELNNWNQSTEQTVEMLKKMVGKIEAVSLNRIDLKTLAESSLRGPINIIDSTASSDLGNIAASLIGIRRSFEFARTKKPDLTKAQWLELPRTKALIKELEESMTDLEKAKETIKLLQKNVVTVLISNPMGGNHLKLFIDEAGNLDVEELKI